MRRIALWICGGCLLLASQADARPQPARGKAPPARAAAASMTPLPNPPPLQPLDAGDLRATVATATGPAAFEGGRDAVFQIGDRSSLSDNPGAQPAGFESHMPDQTPPPQAPEGFRDLGGGRIAVIQGGQ